MCVCVEVEGVWCVVCPCGVGFQIVLSDFVCGTIWPGGQSGRSGALNENAEELNNNRKSHVDRNYKLNMSLPNESFFAHRVQFR